MRFEPERPEVREARARRSLRRAKGATALCLLVFGALSLWATWDQTATADEPIYLAAGLRILETGDLRTNEISSPWLLKAVIALPLWCSGERFDLEDPRLRSPRLALHWRSAWTWLYSPGRPAAERLRLARGVNVLLAIGVGLVIFAMGRRLAGPWGGFAGVLCWCTLPEAMAHAGLASLDMGTTLLTTLTLWAAMPLLSPWCSRWRVLGVGLCLGGCFLAKTSAVILAAFLGAAWLLSMLRRRDEPGRVVLLGRGLAVFAVTLLTLNAGFRFEGSGQPLGEHPRWEGIEGRLDELPLSAQLLPLLERVPSPLPESYLELLAVQTGIGESGKRVYFHGRSREGSWPWFLPAALALKTPAVHLLLLAIGILLLALPRFGLRRGEWGVPLGFFAFLLGFFVLTDRFGLVRYLLPGLPVLALVAGLPLAALVAQVGWRRQLSLPQRWAAPMLALGIAAVCVSVGWVLPHPLSALQWAAGGKWQCHRWFADSNCDWGQDLARAAAHARRRGHERGAIAYFGSGRPRQHLPGWTVLPSVGVEPEPGRPWWYDAPAPPPLEQLPDGPLYVSVTLLRGVQMPGVYAILDGRTPDEMAAPSIAVFLPPHSTP